MRNCCCCCWICCVSKKKIRKKSSKSQRRFLANTKRSFCLCTVRALQCLASAICPAITDQLVSPGAVCAKGALSKVAQATELVFHKGPSVQKEPSVK